MTKTLLWTALSLWVITFLCLNWKEKHGVWPLETAPSAQEETRKRNACWDWLVATKHPLLWHPDVSSISLHHPQWHECFWCHRTPVEHGPCEFK